MSFSFAFDDDACRASIAATCSVYGLDPDDVVHQYENLKKGGAGPGEAWRYVYEVLLRTATDRQDMGYYASESPAKRVKD